MHYQRLKASPAKYVVTAFALGCLAPAYGQNIMMTEHVAYDGMSEQGGVTPVVVNLANLGPDVQGVLTVSNGNFSTDYPVDLGHKEHKTLFTYPDCTQYTDGYVQFDFHTRTSSLARQSLAVSGAPPNTLVIAEVSRSRGDIDFLRSNADQHTFGTPEIAYLDPADAPDRLVGYQRLSALIIGTDATGLSDNSIRAMKDWALQGGTLLFIGGASSAAISDPRWADVMPVHDIKPRDLPASTTQEYSPRPAGDSRTGLAMSRALDAQYSSSVEAFHAMVGKAAPEATSRVGGLILERPMGLGRTVYIAFNPFKDPMNNWDGRIKMFDEILNPAILLGARSVIYSSLMSTQFLDSRGLGLGTVSTKSSSPNNPFEAKLPVPTTVLTILAAYFLVVVPLNFNVLRKLKRGELAWVTAPVISLGFAGVFFGSARGLYGATLSTNTSGMLIAQAGHKDGLVVGNSEMFFPNAGVYDLHLKSVDSINPAFDNYYPNGQDAAGKYDGLSPTDNGEVHAQMRVQSLSFRELTYRQKIEVGSDWIDIARLSNGHFRVTNKSPYALTQVSLAGGGGWIYVGDLAPNVSTEASLDRASAAENLQGQLGRLLVRSHGLAITGTLKGFQAGPHIGSEVSDSSGITLVYMTNLHLNDSEMRNDLLHGGKA